MADYLDFLVPVAVVQPLHLTDIPSTRWQRSQVGCFVTEVETPGPSLLVSLVLLVKGSGQPTDFFFTFGYSTEQLNGRLLAADTPAAQCCD